jgi:hypothetical protein
LQVIRWQTPWPLIQISGCEWVIMRDHPSKPAALVRYLEDKPEERYRVVRWAPDPADRRLFEYFPTLEIADMAVTFIENEPHTGRQALTAERSPEWARFERWFWSQAPDALVLDSLPAWAYRERMTRQSFRAAAAVGGGVHAPAGR